jgi:hypothetical protein
MHYLSLASRGSGSGEGLVDQTMGFLVQTWDFQRNFEDVWSQSCKREDSAYKKSDWTCRLWGFTTQSDWRCQIKHTFIFRPYKYDDHPHWHLFFKGMKYFETANAGEWLVRMFLPAPLMEEYVDTLAGYLRLARGLVMQQWWEMWLEWWCWHMLTWFFNRLWHPGSLHKP